MDKTLLHLFGSKVRIKLLQLFLLSRDKPWYIRRICREINEQINAVRKELKELVKIDFLRSEARANRIYFALRPDFLYLPELLRISAKSSDLGKSLLQNQEALGKIRYCMLALPFVKGRRSKQNEVDLLLIGRINLEKLKGLVSEAERVREHEINYTVFTEDEFSFRKKRRDPFLKDVLDQRQIILIGDEEDLNRWP